MILDLGKERRLYLDKLKNQIKDFLVPFNKRYQEFPWNSVNKVNRITLYSDIPVTINNTKFTVRELVKLVKKYQTELKSKTKSNYYNYILRAYIQDGRHSKNYAEAYKTYSDVLKREFQQIEYDMDFCLQALKELNKSIKNIKESEEALMYGNEYLESIHSDLFGSRDTNMEIYIEALEYFAFDDEENDIITEGVNTDTSDVYVEAKKKIKKLIGDYKKSYKNKDYKTAKLKLLETKKIINNAYDKVEKLSDNGAASVSIGILIEILILGLETLISMPLLFIPKAGGVIFGIKEVIIGAQELVTQIRSVRKGLKSGNGADSWNLYRNRIKNYLKSYNDLCDKYIKKVTEVESQHNEKIKSDKKKEAAYKESARFILKKKAIYEACSNGEITLAEREALLENLRGDRTLRESYIDDPLLTNAEKFKAVKHTLYEKCEQGLLSYSERERLIAEAFDRLMSEEAIQNTANDNNMSKNNTFGNNKATKELEKVSKDAQQNLQKASSDNGVNQNNNNTSSSVS